MTYTSLLLTAMLLQLQLQVPAIADPAPIREQVVDPRGRYCFRIDTGWDSEDHDLVSDSITIRHEQTEVRLSHAERCWLNEHAHDPEAQAAEASRRGLGRRVSLTSLEGRYGRGHLTTYEDPVGRPEAGQGTPFFGCVDVQSGWLILQGTLEATDHTAVRRIAESARIDCNRFDPDER